MTTAAWPTRRSVGSLRGWVPIVAAVGVLGVVMWRLGDGPFVAGLRAIDAATLAAAFGIGLVTTLCCAWRWTIVARGLGVELTLPTAVAAYYRSLFLNVTLPGGVVGDLHRGVSHGRNAHSVPRGLRAVGWERTGGQVVQMVLTVVVLLVLPSPGARLHAVGARRASWRWSSACSRPARAGLGLATRSAPTCAASRAYASRCR